MRVLLAPLFLLAGLVGACVGHQNVGEGGATNTSGSAATGGATGGGGEPVPPIDPLEACEDDLIEALPWFEGEAEADLNGTIEFGQTHIVASDELRIAPRIIAERETLLLFTPDNGLPDDAELRVAGFDGESLLGVLPLSAPAALPAPVEQSYSQAELEPYSTVAYSAFLPWSWLRENVVLRIGLQTDTGFEQIEHIFEDLGAPHRFTISRSKMVLFGEPDKDTSTTSASKLIRDFFPTLPFAELRIVESTPWRLSQVVVQTADGPRMAHSEDERIAITTDANRWQLVKHHFALRMSLANTGRGLALSNDSDGDNSPYGFGTSLGSGWVRLNDGTYVDVNNAGLAAGWTGWTGLWLSECSNGFIHELGHSFTLLHFTGGTAAQWGIDAEYPSDGTNLATHPWGYDSVRRQPRTWYRVDGQGPVMANGELVGKRDPLNGGEVSNSATCFPQFTGYHARKIQRWGQDSPTIATIGGVPGIYRWDSDSKSYAIEQAVAPYENPVAVDVPVVTLIGTLGNIDEVCQTYPPMFSKSGNVFTMPAPTDPDLAPAYVGARWFLEISYADNSVDRTLIARGAMDQTNAIARYSLNVEADRDPKTVRLFRAASAYPSIDPSQAELVHTLDIGPPADPIPEVVTGGRGWLGNAGLQLADHCTPEIDCPQRIRTSSWRVSEDQLHFVDLGGQTSEPAVCTTPGDVTALSVPVLRDGSEPHTVVVHAQRQIDSTRGAMAVPLHDVTPWIDAPDLQQSLKLWLPFAPNEALQAGRYTTELPVQLRGWLGSNMLSDTPLSIDFTVYEPIVVDLATEYVGEGVAADKSSVYYLVHDPTMGPTSRKWWGDSGPTVLTVPMLEEGTNQLTTMKLDAYKLACGSQWEINAGQAAWQCDHAIVLSASGDGNQHLSPGVSYRSPGSSRLVVDARRWHAPNAEQLLKTFAYDLHYVAP